MSWTAEDAEELQLLLSSWEFNQVPADGPWTPWAAKDDQDLQGMIGRMEGAAVSATEPMTVRKQKRPTQRPAGSQSNRRFQGKMLALQLDVEPGSDSPHMQTYPTPPTHPPTVL